MEPIVNQQIEEINNKKCYSCGKIFRTPADLLKHKNRKTPCLIREVAPDQINNPNRCLYCNKIFAQPQTLTRHLKSCKIKNGGMDLLVDEVKYEQKIRILEEKDAAKDREIQDLKNQLKDQVAIMGERLAKLEAKESLIQPQIVNNGTINNIVNNTININQYNRPSIDHLIDKENVKNSELFRMIRDRRLCAPIEIVPKIYFNPDAPENFSIYMTNKKTGETAYLVDLTWKVGNINDKFGHDLLEGINDVIENYIIEHIEDFNFRFMDSQELLDKLRSGRSVGKLRDHHAEELRQYMISGREIVKPTIKPLIKHLGT